jgi:hypothetical protein
VTVVNYWWFREMMMLNYWKTVIDFQGFYFRMSSEDFQNFICLVGPAVTKKKTNFRDPISVTDTHTGQRAKL